MNTIGKLKLGWPSQEELIQLQHIDQEHFPRPWTLIQWQELQPLHHFLGSWIKEESIVGFALFGHLQGDETAHLLKLALLPEFRGKGEAALFWQELLKGLKARHVSKVFLEVEESNEVAQGFYKKVGFKVIRTVHGYYSDGENGLMLLLTL